MLRQVGTRNRGFYSLYHCIIIYMLDKRKVHKRQNANWNFCEGGRFSERFLPNGVPYQRNTYLITMLYLALRS